MEKHTPPWRTKTKSHEKTSSHSLFSPSSPNAAARPLATLHRRSPVSDAVPKRRSTDPSSSSSSALVVLWPSASVAPSKSLSLADHLSKDRLGDLQVDSKKNGESRSLYRSAVSIGSSQSIIRQRSCSEYSTRLQQDEVDEDDKRKKNMNKYRSKGGSPIIIGGSTRYIGEVIRLPPSPRSGSSTPSSVLSSRSLVLRRGKADLGLDFPISELDRDRSETKIPSRKLNLQNREDQLRKPTRTSSSPLIAYGSRTARWVRSPVVDGEAKEEKGRNNSFISLGLDLFRRKWKETPSPSSPHAISSLKKGRAGDDGEHHQLRVMQNRLIQWRWVNVISEKVDLIKKADAQVTILSAWAGISNSQARVARKRVQLEKDKLHLKLIALLSSQLKALEEWSGMAQQHHSALSTTKDCLQAAVCRLPLADGAKGNPLLLMSALRYATDLVLTSRTTISRITDMHGQKTVSQLVELRQVVSRERVFLQECFHLLSFMSSLQIQEQSLKCQLIQLHALAEKKQ
ncbi:hypothetical protein Cni_G13594 [Canna indica]|uniref:QWRF motif-containing protein 3 n=1 Tax=Canna indica TaxID=4628 RepID=A0AAQ3KAI0_9LILI|nr:hypothetical protein Cni_G13594 [Canna indica]